VPELALEEPVCLGCLRLQKALDAALIDIDNLNVDLLVKRRQLREARGENETRADEHPLGDDAEAVFVYWKLRLHPQAKSFKGKRRAHVLARLAESYTVLDLLRAVDGAVVDAWTGPNGVRHDDLEFICRDPSTTDRFIKAAVADGRRREAAWWAGLTDGERELVLWDPEARAEREAA
jgi:predicted Fe-S protein YdhL (DUF1289 family)